MAQVGSNGDTQRPVSTQPSLGHKPYKRIETPAERYG
jgi:hypothetical protein